VIRLWPACLNKKKKWFNPEIILWISKGDLPWQ